MKNLINEHSFFVIDVESIGLHGEAFAVAGGLYVGGAAQWEFRYSCGTWQCSGAESDREWVQNNIPDIAITHRGPRQMRKEFWTKWMQAKRAGALMAADCAWPVESRFIAKCVDDDVEARRWDGPYPLMEIASFLSAAGVDPLADHERTPSELPKHDPLADVRQSARLLNEAILKLKGGHK